MALSEAKPVHPHCVPVAPASSSSTVSRYNPDGYTNHWPSGVRLFPSLEYSKLELALLSHEDSQVALVRFYGRAPPGEGAVVGK